MIWHVDQSVKISGDGTENRPFSRISDAAKIARPGDEVLVAPGIYREYVNPEMGGTENARITYRSTTIKGAVITGAEVLTGWEKTEIYGKQAWRTVSSVHTILIQHMYTETGTSPASPGIQAVYF